MYVWRDPRRITPQRAAELAELDATSPRSTQKQARLARFRMLRASGMSIRAAAHEVGVSVWTGQNYQLQIDAERARGERRRRR